MVKQRLKIWVCYEAKARGAIALGLIANISNIKNKTQTDRDEPVMKHHQQQTQASATARGSN